MTADPTAALLIQAALAGVALAWSAVAIHRRGLFRWSRAGFWAWSSFALFLFAVPAYGLFAQNTTFYYTVGTTLAVSGGLPRSVLIAIASAVGIVAFFLAYLRTTEPRAASWGFEKTAELPTGVKLFLGICSVIGLYSLVVYRAALTGSTGVVQTDGRFVSGASGYQVDAHMLLFVPVAALLLARQWSLRTLGLSIALLYIAIGSLDPFGRYLSVSMLILVSIAYCVRHGRRWPKLWMLLAVILVAGILQLRGHTHFTSASDAATLAVSVPSQSLTFLGSQGNMGMLNTWYLQSYVSDNVAGYNYGIPLVNYTLTGFLPNTLFPWKYFMVDWLQARQNGLLQPYYTFRLAIQKPTLLGSFYSDGGFLGMILLTLCAGYLTRKTESMFSEDSPTLVRATALAWACTLWQVFASASWWGLSTLGILALPTLGSLLIWRVCYKRNYGRTRIQSQALQVPSA